MSNDLDKIFKEKLGDFQELPDDKVWQAIEASLDKKTPSRKVIPLWWKLSGIAALFALLFFAIGPLFTSDPLVPVITDIEHKEPATKQPEASPSVTPPVMVDSQNESTNDHSPAHTLKENNFTTKETETTIVAADKTTVSPSGNAHKDQPLTTTNNSHPRLPKNMENTLATADQNKQTTEPDSPLDSDIQLAEEDKKPSATDKLGVPPSPTATELAEKEDAKKSIFDEINNATEETIALEEDQKGKWSAGPSIAPVYFNGMGTGSPINTMLASNSKTGNLTMSYGVTVAYKVSKKLSVRSGIHKVDFGYNTNDVSYTSSFNAASAKSQLKNINYSNSAKSIIFNDPNTNVIPKPQGIMAMDVIGKNVTRKGTMGQQLGYVEIPLELNYVLLDQKFGINLIGGVSSLVLTDNSVVLESSGQTTEIGEANNINDLNFSTNIGFGLNYKFSKAFKFNVEPIFKYQLNTFSDTSGNFNPYSLGVYSGFSFKF
ncbi:hypothetical protein HCG49_09505 [Arenibacter sp. 6A1]|uniref:hypothetical protein n=1 Tax=Arenibacter sp. 6A1 TaxID=2720391 RepID=UPI00144790A5|nr:hypothetical protein [Arenibacter sp. 6A1]NKI26797.1 hypothetical protein [Arenibacter sp. 6A1]